MSTRANKRSCQITRERGVAAVEFAIALPFLLVLMLATMELARGIMHYNTLTKSTRDGVRYLAGNAMLGTTNRVLITDDVRAETQNLVVYGHVNATGEPMLPGLSQAHVAVSDSGDNTVTVSVDYPYQPFLGARLPMFGTGADESLAFNLRATVVMRAL